MPFGSGFVLAGAADGTEGPFQSQALGCPSSPGLLAVGRVSLDAAAQGCEFHVGLRFGHVGKPVPPSSDRTLIIPRGLLSLPPKDQRRPWPCLLCLPCPGAARCPWVICSLSHPPGSLWLLLNWLRGRRLAGFDALEGGLGGLAHRGAGVVQGGAESGEGGSGGFADLRQRRGGFRSQEVAV